MCFYTKDLALNALKNIYIILFLKLSQEIAQKVFSADI